MYCLYGWVAICRLAICRITICRQKSIFLTDHTKNSRFVKKLSKMSKQEENDGGLTAGGRSVLTPLANLLSSVSSVLWSLHIVKK